MAVCGAIVHFWANRAKGLRRGASQTFGARTTDLRELKRPESSTCELLLHPQQPTSIP